GIRLTIDTARTEALRPGRIKHQRCRRFPLDVQAMDMTRALATTRHRLAVRANVRNVVAGNGQTAVPGRERAGGVGVSCEAVPRATGIDASMRYYGIRFRAEPGEARSEERR